MAIGRPCAADVVIQNGTRHTWHNESDQPVVMLGAAPPTGQAS